MTPAHIFRAYDIRGRVDDELSLALTELIGRAIGSEVLNLCQTILLIGRDGRL